MSRSTPALLLFAALSFACGGPLQPGTQDPNPVSNTQQPLAVLGRWRWPQATPELALTTVLTSDAFTVIADCDFGGMALTAQTSSPATIDATTIEVLGDAHDDETRNGADCHATIKAGTLRYTLQGNDVLELTAPGEPSLTLTRVSN